MPRIALTAAQREAAKIADRNKALSDGLLIYKAVNRITFAQQAKTLGINPRTLNKVINGESCQLPLSTVWRMLDMAGLSTNKNKEGGSGAKA